MNERIKELAEQAGLGYERWNTTEQFEKFMEKFAELLVRECAKVAARTGALNEADFEGEMIADAIKEHFGVE